MRSTFHIGAANISPRSDFIFAKQIFHVAKQHISGCSSAPSALLWATTPKRRRWRMQRGGDGAAVEIARRSKAQAISGTARGQASPSASAKKEKAPSGAFFFFTGKTLYPRHARAGHHRRSAAGGWCSEAVMAQRSKLRAAPRRWQFRAPQEGEQSSANFFILITKH